MGSLAQSVGPMLSGAANMAGSGLTGAANALNSPTTTTLLPTALGALGGYLTSPRMAGGRGALGRALLGGAEGLSTGQEAAARAMEARMNAQHMQLVDQQLKTAIAQKDKSRPTLARIVSTFYASPMGQKVFPGSKPADFADMPFDTLVKMQQDIPAVVKAMMTGQKPNIHYSTETVDGVIHRTRDVINPDGTMTHEVLGVSGDQAKVNAQIADTQAKLTVSEREHADTLGNEAFQAAQNRQSREFEAAENRKSREFEGQQNREARAEQEGANRAERQTEHGETTEKDIQTQADKEAEQAWKAKTESYLFGGKMRAGDHDKYVEDYKAKRVPQLETAVRGAVPAHAHTGEGLPAGATPNGDGTWRLPDGRVVRPR